jgi:uncharacterized membrane protein YvbJ
MGNIMIYCTKCGTKNNPTENYCVKCGAPLEKSNKSWDQKVDQWGENVGNKAEKWGEDFGRRAEKWGEEFEKQAQDGCFGLAKNMAILGIILGIIIILAGILLLVGIQLLRILGSLMILAFGLIILVTALKYLTKKH